MEQRQRVESDSTELGGAAPDGVPGDGKREKIQSRSGASKQLVGSSSVFALFEHGWVSCLLCVVRALLLGLAETQLLVTKGNSTKLDSG